MGENLETSDRANREQKKLDVIDAYNAWYLGQTKSETVPWIWRDVYGDDYLEEIKPTSYVTKTDLVRIVRLLELGSGKTLIDLGCGSGGPGLWVARETGADLLGIDLAPNGIALAKQRISEFGLQGRARFSVADLCSTGLPDGSCHGAMSIDVFVSVTDKAAALDEVARILCPGSRFVFTTWERIKGSSLNHRRLLQESGFLVEAYDEKPDWRRRQLAVYERVLEKEAVLIEEMGESSASVLINDAKRISGMLPNLRHVFIVCSRA